MVVERLMTAYSRQMSLTTQRDPDSKCCMPRKYSYHIPRQQIKPIEWQSDKNPCNVDIIYVRLIFYVIMYKAYFKKKEKVAGDTASEECSPGDREGEVETTARDRDRGG